VDAGQGFGHSAAVFGRLILVVCALMIGGCSPLWRFGDLEPPEGQRVLVDVRVIPTDRDIPADVVLAAGRGAERRLMLRPAPRVGSDVVTSEMSSEVQGQDVPASSAPVDAIELGTDARRVEAMYAARGYFGARVRSSDLVEIAEGRVRFDVYIDEGQPTTVREVVFAGITPGDDAAANRRLDEIRAALPEVAKLERGDVWDEELYLRSLDAIQTAFRERGFIHAVVTGQSLVSRGENLAAIRFDIDHGPLVRAEGKAVIEGNAFVPKARVLRRVTVDDGDILEAEALRETEQQVFDLGPFFSVQARPLKAGDDAVDVGGSATPPLTPMPGATQTPGAPAVGIPEGPIVVDNPSNPDDGVVESDLPDRVPVEVKLTTTSPWDLTIGPAVLTDLERLELALPVTFTHRAAIGDVATLRATAKPALVLPDAFIDCCQEARFGFAGKLTLDVPSFFEEFLRLSTSVGYELDQEEPKNEEIRARIGLSRRLGGGFTFSFGYDLSQVFYFDDSPLEGLSPEDASAVAFRFRDDDRVMWVGASLIYDRRDGIYDARRGFFAALSVDGGVGAIGSTVDFFRTIFEARGYLTLDALPTVTLALRGKAGLTFYPGSQGTPESIRFESGGPNAHRGFRTSRMGDYVCVASKQVGSDFRDTVPACGGAAEDRVYIGGNYVFEANLELRVQPGTLGFVAFLDAGRLWSRFGDIALDDLFVAVGPGLRLATPVGPLRVDIGFLLGRNRERVFHFSLGQAF